jgi:hypothetical protein
MSKFSGMLTIKEAAGKAGVSSKTIRLWKKESNFPRFINHSRQLILIFEKDFDKYLEQKRQPKPERTWKSANKRLKAGDLTSISSLKEKLKERKDRNWTDVQRRVNGFDDTHIAAYRRGLSDAINILNCSPIEYIDYVPHIGQLIDVGSCVGKVTDITDTLLTVSGVYHYSDGEQDHWTFHYKLDEIQSREVRCCKIFNNKVFWDFEHIPRHQ